jgi:hypothetical protein
MEEKVIKYEAKEINGQWYMTGGGLMIKVKDQEYAETLARIYPTIEITDPNFTPGRRKKAV